MFSLLSITFFGCMTLLVISLQKTYQHLPQRELKRRAQKGDEFAKMLFQVSAYGVSLSVLMWAITGFVAAGFFVIVSRSTPAWLALLGSVSVIWLGFAWIPGTKLTRFGMHLAKFITPSIAWLMRHMYPALHKFGNFVHNHHPIFIHTGLYQKEDLLELMDQQKVQTDNRMSEEELSIAKNALTFNDKLIREIMTPKRMVKMVKDDEAVGPVLLDELHKSGFSRFPVFDGDQDSIVGTLFIKDLVNLQSGGKVREHMSKHVYYVNEEQPLSHALAAFLKTRHHLFIVVNNFEEIVGVVSIEDILEQILGKNIVDEFDKYEDLRAVAKLEASQEKHKRQISQS